MVDEAQTPQPVPARRPRLTPRQIFAQTIMGGLILLSGVAIGTGGSVLILKDRIIWRLPMRDGARRPDPNRIVDEWTAKYGLNEEQAQRVKEIFTRRFEAHRAHFSEMVKRAQTEREAFAAAVKEILTPEQYERWERDFRERSERYRRMWPGPRRRPRGPGRGGTRDEQARAGRRLGSHGPEANAPASGLPQAPPPPPPP
jgi:hypothetical protein